MTGLKQKGESRLPWGLKQLHARTPPSLGLSVVKLQLSAREASSDVRVKS